MKKHTLTKKEEKAWELSLNTKNKEIDKLSDKEIEEIFNVFCTNGEYLGLRFKEEIGRRMETFDTYIELTLSILQEGSETTADNYGHKYFEFMFRPKMLIVVPDKVLITKAGEAGISPEKVLSSLAKRRFLDELVNHKIIKLPIDIRNLERRSLLFTKYH